MNPSIPITTAEPVVNMTVNGPDLFERVYSELREMASSRIHLERPGQTLSATALVHEVYLRLFGQETGVSFASRRQFFAAAAQSMQRIMIESARRKQTRKRSGSRLPVDLEVLCGRNFPNPDLILTIDEGLQRLQSIDPEAAELVRLRVFVGASMPEAAVILDRPLRSTERLWTYSRAFLARELREANEN